MESQGMYERALIFEYAAGGGLNKEKIPASLFCEGFAMLRSAIEDFTRLGLTVVTLLDERMKHLKKFLNAERILNVRKEDGFLDKFQQGLSLSQSCFIIAPEFFSTLYQLTKLAKREKKKILSVCPEGILLGSSKIETYRFFRESGVLTPETWLIPVKENKLDDHFVLEKFEDLDHPVVIKPDDGVSAENIAYLKSKKEIKDFFDQQDGKMDLNRRYILQEFVEGNNMSVSLIKKKNGSNSNIQKILSVNGQDLQIKDPLQQSQYKGGWTPVTEHSKIAKQLRAILEKMDLSRFDSYFGIDFIQKDDELWLIEINPRLTTSYIGIRRVLNRNPLNDLINKGDNFFSPLSINKHSIFSRMELIYHGEVKSERFHHEVLLNLMKQIPEIVTPPISFKGDPCFSCMVATECKDFQSSEKRLEQIKQDFKNFQLEVVD